MRKSRFTEEQIAYAIRQVDQGTPAAELCRKMGISERPFYTWKKKYAGMRTIEPGGGQTQYPPLGKCPPDRIKPTAP